MEGSTSEKKQVKWTTVKIPVEIRDKIKRMANRFGMSQWELVNWALGFAETRLKRADVKQDLPAMDKVSWYISKLGLAVGAFRENPNERTLDNAVRVCAQIMDRLGVDTSSLIKVLHDYYDKKDKKESKGLKMEVSMELKFVIAEIIWTQLVEKMNEEDKK